MEYKTTTIGFPRIGEHRELKTALEGFWSKKLSLRELEDTAKKLRRSHWLAQNKRGVDLISCNDFSYYDQMLDTTIMLGAIPKRFQDIEDSTEQYFAMARGNQDAVAMGMTKWFNTNYHYIVPELSNDIKFQLNTDKIFREYREAKAFDIDVKINIIGPLTFLALSKTDNGSDPLDYLPKILPLYKDLLQTLKKEVKAALTIQIEEPIFVKDPSPRLLESIEPTYQELSSIDNEIRILVSTYFEHACEAVSKLVKTNIWGIGLDFVYGKKNLDCLTAFGNKVLVAGIIDAKNIWRSNLAESLDTLEQVTRHIDKEQIILSSSCSLLHVPYTIANEPDSDIKEWMSFAFEKLDELTVLAHLFYNEEPSLEYKEKFTKNQALCKSKTRSDKIQNPVIQKAIGSLKKLTREGSFAERNKLQKEVLKFPLLATTTIGSFPQTQEIRKLRRDYKAKRISFEIYQKKIQEYIDNCITFQEQIGLDVLVHGEPERNDMVEYFGELMDGFHFTKKGWVQSYGSRCVKPPILYGDISRPKAMTIEWIAYAQSKTSKPVKGMLTGPVTIMNWSFVRNDISCAEIAKQIGLALAQEIHDLQEAGIQIIQVDEAAFKEGYPLRKENISDYETWAVAGFQLAVSTAKQETQIHSHMCYSEFNDIIKTIEKMDADVITIETARSGNKLLQVFHDTHYQNHIGPGVYDIHSPRVPTVEEFKKQILQRLEVVDKQKMWVNPDCGLKTRQWQEVKEALSNMVQATNQIRNQ